MEYLKIKNWDKWQSYRADRGQPPWIKIHRCVMRNPEWVALSDLERGQLVSMWLLAADNNGLIPDSHILIQKLCFMSSPLKLNKFKELGFICQGDAKVTPDRRQHDPPEKRRIEKNREEKNSLPQWLSKDLWQTFLNHRKSFKPALTDHAEKLNLNKLIKFHDKGYNCEEIINNTISNGWKSFFEPNGKPKNDGSDIKYI